MASRSLAGTTVVVAGAGLAGLTAARDLESRGAAVTVVEAASSRFDLALAAALRTSGAAGVASQALGVMGALVLFALGHWLHGGGGDVGERARHASLALPGYALGASLVALLGVRTAGVYASSSRVGELGATLADATVARQETKNPALVSAMIGERLSAGVGAARLVAVTAVASAAAIVIGASSGDSGLIGRKIAFPLLFWAFGLVANGAGLSVARSLEAEGAVPALARGQASAAVILVFGLIGAGYWLFPGSWPPLALAAALGLAASSVATFFVARAASRHGGPLRDVLDALRAGPAPAQAAAFGFGLRHAALTGLLLAIAAIVAEHLGASSDAPSGTETALLLAVFGALAWGPYALASEAGAAVADTARRLASMAGVDPETSRRLQRLVDSQQVTRAVAESQATLAAAAAALATFLGGFSGEHPPSTPSAGWVALAGVAWVLAGVGAAARRAARAGRDVTLEVERQLASPAGDGNAEERPTNYRASEELAARAGLSGALRGSLALLAGPVVLGIALKVVYRESGPRLAAEALAMFVAGAAVTALGVALTVDGARAALAGARRANRPEGDPATYAASVTGDALAEILSSAVGPLAGTLALVAAALALFAKSVQP